MGLKVEIKPSPEKKTFNFKKTIDQLFGIDLRSLATFRIAISILIIFDLIFRAPDLIAFYSDEGVLPRSVHTQQYDSWYASLYLINGLPLFQAALFLMTGFFAVLFLFGYHTKIVTIALWFLVLSLHSRNPLILTGGDTLLHLLLFWSMFLPMGACWSIDSTSNLSGQKLSESVLSVATLAILLQLVFVYEFTAICKIGPEWLNGNAIYYALNIDQYVSPFGLFLRKFPHLMKLLTHGVYGFEILGPILLFVPIFTGPVRILLILGFFCLQLGFGSCLSVGIFPFATSVAMLPFLPTWFWDKLSPCLTSVKSLTKLNKLFNKNFFPKVTYKPQALTTSWFANTLATIFLINVLMWNLQSVESLRFQMPEWFRRVGFFLGLEQGWIMFGPKTIKEDFWYVYPGTLKNGKKIDLFTDSGEISWEKPKKVLSSMYKNHRWRTYIRNLWVSNNLLYPPYGQYLCSKWNKTHKGDNELLELEFYYTRENTLPNNKTEDLVTGLLYKHMCY